MKNLENNFNASKKIKMASPMQPFNKKVKIFPLSKQNQSMDICSNLDRNLFQLERNLALFHFALKEVKEIS